MFADANHIFKNRSRVPMILHCGHNICLGCLKSASRYQPVIKCTVCQVLIFIISPKFFIDSL